MARRMQRAADRRAIAAGKWLINGTELTVHASEDAVPDAFDKGWFGGSCNRSACQAPGAEWFNHSTHKYYCEPCAALINRANHVDAMRDFGHQLCTKGRHHAE